MTTQATKRAHAPALQTMIRGKHGLLLLALLIRHIASPFSNHADYGSLISIALIIFVQVVGVRSVVHQDRRLRVFFLTVLIVSLGLYSASLFFEGTLLLLLAMVGFAIFYVELIRVIVADVLRPGRVDIDRIMGALAAYMLLASLWAVAYIGIQWWIPGSFEFEPNPTYQVLVIDEDTGEESWEWKPDVRQEERIMAFDDDIEYFSFVTLTTLGYGEIVPKGALARNLATLEAMIGPIYLAVLLARLVSLNATQSRIESLGRDA